MIRTKIVATLGPATSQVDVLLRLLEEGMDVCRLNFSHGELDSHVRTLQNVRSAARQAGCPLAVLGDLGGPKIRIGPVADENGTGGMPVSVGDRVYIQRQPVTGANGRISTTYERFVDDVSVGDRILIEDGLIRFIAIEKEADEIVCTCIAGGILKSAKGINLPNTHVSIPSITEQDWRCIDWAIDNGLDYLALSFVRRAEELIQLRQYLAGRNSDIQLIAKIEKAEALDHIDAIIEASDGLMVARGDLGVEMDVARVPIIQKDLIRRCRAAGKSVIVATQMLQSMIEHSSPTRAEVSDVANAIIDGTDAIMLSGETAVGRYPAATVHMMAHIAEVTESYLAGVRTETIQPIVQDKIAPFSGAIAHGVWEMVRDLHVKLVVVWSQTGRSARIFSKYRFPVPLIAPSDNQRILQRTALHYGVIPVEMPTPPDMPALVRQVDRLVQERRLAAPNDRIVIVAGSSMGAPLTINGIVIHTVGEAQAASAPLPAAVSQLVELEKS